MTPTQNMGRNTPCRAQPRPVLLVVTPPALVRQRRGFFSTRVHSLGTLPAQSRAPLPAVTKRGAPTTNIGPQNRNACHRPGKRRTTMYLLIGPDALVYHASGFQVAS